MFDEKKVRYPCHYSVKLYSAIGRASQYVVAEIVYLLHKANCIVPSLWGWFSTACQFQLIYISLEASISLKRPMWKVR